MDSRILFLDCVGGVAGDMLLGALVEACGKPELLDQLPGRLGLDDVALVQSRGRPGGFAASRLEVRFQPDCHPRRRGLREITDLLGPADIPDQVRQRALAVFGQLATAEAKVHGGEPETVHFHEVGAVDALIDVVGSCLALDALSVEEVVCSPLPMGRGRVECEHGTLPLPAPAVAAMLPGVPVYDGGITGETVTPTGAALVTTLSDRFGAMPTMTVTAVGVGAGTREYPGLPNILRAFVGKAQASSGRPSEENLIVECNLDDCDPQVLPVVIESLFAAGALDAYLTPLVMKKGRPGHLVTALTTSRGVAAAIAVLLRETTTLGCRTYPVTKHTLGRRMETAMTPWGEVAVKVALDGDRVLRRVPEFAACAELARRAGVPVRDVLAAAGSCSGSSSATE